MLDQTIKKKKKFNRLNSEMVSFPQLSKPLISISISLSQLQSSTKGCTPRKITNHCTNLSLCGKLPTTTGWKEEAVRRFVLLFIYFEIGELTFLIGRDWGLNWIELSHVLLFDWGFY